LFAILVRLETIGAGTDELDSVIDNLPPILLLRIGGERHRGRIGKVVNSTALQASDVVVLFNYRIKPSFLAASLQLPDLFRRDQNFEVTIDCPETDARQTVPHRAIQLTSGRMLSRAPEFFQNDAPLNSITLGLVIL
jgi:hypothetical protein